MTKLYEKMFFLDYDEMVRTSFTLYIEGVEGETLEDYSFALKSDVIPVEMLEPFEQLISPCLIYKSKDSFPDGKYLEELLDFISSEISKDSRYEAFYYPSFFFDEEHNVRSEVVRRFETAKLQIRYGDVQVINMCRPLHLFYLSQLVRIPKVFLTQKKFSVHRISRLDFESSLKDSVKVEEYVEIYFSAVRFKIIKGRAKEPLYFIALNKRNEPILAIYAEDQD